VSLLAQAATAAASQSEPGLSVTMLCRNDRVLSFFVLAGVAVRAIRACEVPRLAAITCRSSAAASAIASADEAESAAYTDFTRRTVPPNADNGVRRITAQRYAYK
jgi:hypothetical protein